MNLLIFKLFLLSEKRRLKAGNLFISVVVQPFYLNQRTLSALTPWFLLLPCPTVWWTAEILLLFWGGVHFSHLGTWKHKPDVRIVKRNDAGKSMTSVSASSHGPGGCASWPMTFSNKAVVWSTTCFSLRIQSICLHYALSSPLNGRIWCRTFILSDKLQI